MRGATLGGLLVYVVFLTGCLGADTRLNTTSQDQPVDAFYRVTAEELKPGDHGQLIRQGTEELRPPAGLENAKLNVLTLYKSYGNEGENTPLAVSAIVAIPKGEKPSGGWPIVSWAHGTVGGADKCAPSMDNQLVADTPALQLHKKINHAPHEMLNAFLDAGWAVVMTDYQGLGTAGPHPYLNGESEARAVLDAVTAAHQMSLKDVSGPLFSPKYAIVGHSQGGQAALFAAHRQPEWENELELVGVAAIAPASDVAGLQLLPGLPPSPEVSDGLPFFVLALEGVKWGDPNVDLANVLTPAGQKLFDETADSLCRTEISESRWTQDHQALFDVKLDAARDRQFRAMHPNLTVAVPIRISQAVEDKRVAPWKTRALARQLKATNAGDHSLVSAVCYQQYAQVAPADPISLGAHFGILKTDIGDIKSWLTLRFQGHPTSECEPIPIG